MPITKEDIIRKIPTYNRALTGRHPRSEFKDIYRMLHSYVYTEDELRMLDAQVVAMVKQGDYD